MESEHPISSRLKHAREARHLTIAELSKITNIRIHIIQALDEGRIEELPRVYMRSFIKRYALAVGIPAAEIEELMDNFLAVEVVQQSSAQRPSQSGSTKSRNNTAIPVGSSPQKRRWLTTGYLMLGILILAGLYYMYTPRKVNTVPSASTTPPVVVSDKDSASNVPASGGALMNYFGMGIDSVSLEAQTTDTVWINITVDGKTTEQITMQPHQTKKWMAAEKFILSLGNAGGVVLKRNGVQLPQLGRLGETVRSIRITKSEFVTSASPWRSQKDTVKAKPVVAPVPPPAKQTTPQTKQTPQQSKQPQAQSKAPIGASNNRIVDAKQQPQMKSPTQQQGSRVPPTSPLVQKTAPSISNAAKAKAPTSVVDKKAALKAKAQLDEILARKKRLERIRRESRRPDLTPVQIKP